MRKRLRVGWTGVSSPETLQKMPDLAGDTTLWLGADVLNEVVPS